MIVTPEDRDHQIVYSSGNEHRPEHFIEPYISDQRTPLGMPDLPNRPWETPRAGNASGRKHLCIAKLNCDPNLFMQMKAALASVRLPEPLTLEPEQTDSSWSSEGEELGSGAFNITVPLAPSRALELVRNNQSALQELADRLQNHVDLEPVHILQEFIAD